jgi:hypothetical protein
MEKQSAEYTDEQFIQEVKKISREIVKENFPEEEEYFDFLFELIMPELQEMEPGEEAEFLREIRGVHPLALGCTAVITVVFQVLAQYRYFSIDTEVTVKNDVVTEEKVEKIVTNILGDGEEQENFSGIPQKLVEYIEKAKLKIKE